MLRAARAAVAVIGMLDAEARPSRLSFADIVKRFVEMPEDMPGALKGKVRTP